MVLAGLPTFPTVIHTGNMLQGREVFNILWIDDLGAAETNVTPYVRTSTENLKILTILEKLAVVPSTFFQAVMTAKRKANTFLENVLSQKSSAGASNDVC